MIALDLFQETPVIDCRKIREVAKFARIALRDDETETMKKELEAVFLWADQLETIQESPPLLGSCCIHPRADVVIQEASVEDILKNAPQVDQDMFVVPSVL